jgi:hypothetical protein
MPNVTESTSFTKDAQGRYLCNDAQSTHRCRILSGPRIYAACIRRETR